MYGPKVIGQEKFDALQAHKKASAGGVYGKRVTGGVRGDAPVAEKPSVPVGEAALTSRLGARDLGPFLAANPSQIDAAIKLETEDGKPRKSALAIIIDAERQNGNRDQVVDYLQRVLSAFDAKAATAAEEYASSKARKED